MAKNAEIKSTTNAVRKVVSFLGEHWGEIYTVWDVLGNILGKGSGPDENAPPGAKRISGMFGQGDEIKLVKAFQRFNPADQQVLLGLLKHNFGDLETPRSWLLALVTYAQSNKWRKLVTDLDTPALKVGTKKMTSTKGTPPDSETTTTEEDLFRGETLGTHDFLKRLVSIIKSEARKEGKTLGDGYKAATDHMRTLGLPLMPNPETIAKIDGFLPTIESIGEWFTNNGNPVAEAIHRQAEASRERVKELGWFQKLIQKLVS